MSRPAGMNSSDLLLRNRATLHPLAIAGGTHGPGRRGLALFMCLLLINLTLTPDTIATGFTGAFDGQGHTINGLYINRPSTSYVGLFGYTSDATLRNVGLMGGSVMGISNVGGLVGYNTYDGTVTNSYATGDMNGTDDYVGGLMGYNNAGKVGNSYWDKDTTGQSTSSGSAASSGKTTAEMRQASTFAGWDLAAAGGSSAVWRIYEGKTSPLLRSFLTGLTLADTTVTYNGSTQTGAAVPTLDALFGTTASGRNAGAYIAYSNQQGYDITGGTLTIDKATLTITAVTNTKTYDGTSGAALPLPRYQVAREAIR